MRFLGIPKETFENRCRNSYRFLGTYTSYFLSKSIHSSLGFLKGVHFGSRKFLFDRIASLFTSSVRAEATLPRERESQKPRSGNVCIARRAE